MQIGDRVYHYGPAINSAGFSVHPARVTQINDSGSINIEITTDDGRIVPAYGQERVHALIEGSFGYALPALGQP